MQMASLLNGWCDVQRYQEFLVDDLKSTSPPGRTPNDICRD